MQHSFNLQKMRLKFAKKLWNITLHTNVLYGDDWKHSADEMVKEFQVDVIRNVHRGYTGTEPGVRIWTFTSSLMYSLTVFTTIGKESLGNAVSIEKDVPLLNDPPTTAHNFKTLQYPYKHQKSSLCPEPKL